MDLQAQLISVAHHADMTQDIVSIYDRVMNRYPDVDKEIRTYEMDECNGRILFPVLQANYPTQSHRIAILAHAFRVNGYRPHIILCKSDLNLCHAKDRYDTDWMCDVCFQRGTHVFDKFGLDYTTSSEVLGDDSVGNLETDINLENYKGVNIERYAIASTRRHLRRYTLNLEDRKHNDVYHRFVRSGIVCTDLADRLLTENDYEALITRWYGYIYGGLFLEKAKQFGLNAYSLGAGKRKQHLVFGKISNRSPQQYYVDDELLRIVTSNDLTSKQNDELKQFMINRFEGDNAQVDHARFAHRGIRSTDLPTVGVFTNLLWDASLAQDDLIFSSPIEWINHTIDYFAEKDDIRLIIKAHPAETIRGTREGVYDHVRETYDLEEEDYENIDVLKPDTEVNPYYLFDELDAGVVYNSTIGMEMAYQEIPVIVVGDTHYREVGFSWDPTTIHQYEELLDQITHLKMNKDMEKICRRYLHFLFLRKHIPFKYYEYIDGDAHLCDVYHDEIVNDKNLKHIIDNIVQGKPVHVSSDLR